MNAKTFTDAEVSAAGPNPDVNVAPEPPESSGIHLEDIAIAWQDGYAACYERLKDADRLLPSSGPSLIDYQAAVYALDVLTTIQEPRDYSAAFDEARAVLRRLRGER